MITVVTLKGSSQMKKNNRNKFISFYSLLPQDLLSQLHHYNANVKHSALLGLKELLSISPSLLEQHLSRLLSEVAAVLTDKDHNVRVAAARVLRLDKHVKTTTNTFFFLCLNVSKVNKLVLTCLQVYCTVCACRTRGTVFPPPQCSFVLCYDAYRDRNPGGCHKCPRRVPRALPCSASRTACSSPH